MDTLTRWSISIGVGALLGLGVLGAHNAITMEPQNESAGFALTQLVPEHKTVDVTIHYDTFNLDDYVAMVGKIQQAGISQDNTCGGPLNPAHVCTITATLPHALDLRGAHADVIRDSFALTTGDYRSRYQDILTTAGTVLATTDGSQRPVTYEGNGTFTLDFIGTQSMSARIDSWRFAVAAIPNPAVWLGAGAVAIAGAVLFAALFRPRPEQLVDEGGVEVFDELFED